MGVVNEPSKIDFPRGSIVDEKFRIEARLGKGAMGSVYLATDLFLDRPVALKIVDPTRIDTERAKKLFRNEAIAMARIRHPNVVLVFSFGYHGHVPYLVSEYVQGETVGVLLRRSGPLHIDVALGILDQAAAALDAVHEAGLVHCDVKPDNLMVGPELRVQLMDFGLARLELDSSRARKRTGTPNYMAPEVIRGKPLPSGDAYLSDIYSFGVTAFQLLTGRLPFECEDFKALAKMHLHDVPPLISTYVEGLGDAFGQAVAVALEKDPYSRYSNCVEMMTALRDARDAIIGNTPTPLRRILVVDDDPDVLKFFNVAFQSAFDDSLVSTASDGLAALELAKAQFPQLLVVDLNMPRLDGLSLISIIKQVPELSETAIMVVSGALDQKRQERLAELGVQTVLQKPVSVRVLTSEARRLMKARIGRGRV